MGFLITIFGSMLSALITWKIPNTIVRLFVTVVATYIFACAAYWLPLLISATDQAYSWQWLAINLYFKVGVFFGTFIVLVTKFIKTAGAQSNAN